MITLRLVCLIFALICFFLVALDIKPPRANLLGVGLVFWVLAELVR